MKDETSSAATIDTWVNLLRGAKGGEIGPEGESIFRRYGAMDWMKDGTKPESLVAEMDATGVAMAGLCSTEPLWVAETCARFPGRFFGIVAPDPTDLRACLTTIESCVREHGFKAVKIEPFLWGKPPSDAMYYPIYAKCVDLDIAFTTQIGHTGPLYPSEPGRPIHLDQVALDFPDLRIVGGHIGWPWTEEAIALAWKHANFYIDTSAHVPKHFPVAFVHFMKTFGQDKCLFASDWPLLPLARPLGELDEHCALPAPVRRKFLRDNAIRAFKLEPPDAT